MLCDRCQQREATVFACVIVDGRQTTPNLCEQCAKEYFRGQQQEFAATASGAAWTSYPPPEFPSLPFLDGTQHCFYCGGVATSASMNQDCELAVRHEPFHYTCFRCAEIEHQLTQEALSALPDDLPTAEQVRRIQQIIRDVDNRVRERVRDDPT